MKRVVLFLVTNLAVLVVVGIAASLLDLNPFVGDPGRQAGAVLALVALGFSGSFVSLLISKPVAKWSTGAKVINDSHNARHRWLTATVQRLAQKAGIAMPQVAIYKGAPNAFATGAFKNSALVAVSSGLLAKLQPDEIEAVLAHEVAHIANGDMVTLGLIQGVCNTFVVFVSMAIGYMIDNVVLRGHTRGVAYYVTTVILELILGVLAAIVVAWFSRQREYRADAGSADLMGRRQPMIDALARLGGVATGPLPGAVEAMGFSGRSGGLMSLFATHPPIEDRIRALQQAA